MAQVASERPPKCQWLRVCLGGYFQAGGCLPGQLNALLDEDAYLRVRPASQRFGVRFGWHRSIEQSHANHHSSTTASRVATNGAKHSVKASPDSQKLWAENVEERRQGNLPRRDV